MTIKTSFVNILIGSAVFWTALFSLLYFSTPVEVVAFPSGEAVFIVNGTETNCTINATKDRSTSDLEKDFKLCLEEFEKYKGSHND